MPFINGRHYINPAHGRALERARSAESERDAAASQREQNAPAPGDHWVTIDHRHVLIQAAHAGGAQRHTAAPRLSARDKAYLDKYYDAVAALAKAYDVDPTLVLGVGVESGFASKGTYLSTGDAFGMTRGSTKNMTRAASPSENARQFFDNFGDQIRGIRDDTTAFINALQGRDASRKRVPGWKVYNSVNPNWSTLVTHGIHEMKQTVPAYLSQRE